MFFFLKVINMFDDTEAAHLAEIEEYLGDIEECEVSYYNRKPSTTSEKHHYVMAKTQCFLTNQM